MNKKNIFYLVFLYLLFACYAKAIDVIIINDSKAHNITVQLKDASYVDNERINYADTRVYDEKLFLRHTVKRGHFSIIKDCDLFGVSFWKKRILKSEYLIPSELSEIKINFGILPKYAEIIVVRVSSEYKKNYEIMSFLPRRNSVYTIVGDREKMRSLSGVILELRKIQENLKYKKYCSEDKIESEEKIWFDIEKLNGFAKEYEDVLKTKLAFKSIKIKLKKRLLDMTTK